MKSIYSLILVFVLSLQSSKAQTQWAQPGATWYYSCTDPLAYGYQKFERINDTVFNGRICQQFLESNSLLIWGFPQFFQTKQYSYQSNDTVYIWNTNKFVIHSIYNAQVGDTWLMPGDTNNCNTIAGYFHVDSISYIVICNDTLTRWFLTAYLPDLMGGLNTYPTFLTEKIGYDFAMFPYYRCFPDYQNCSHTRCYSDSAGCIYSTGVVPYCTYVTAIAQNNKAAAISILPNPASTTFTIKNRLGLNNINTLELTNVTGKTVLVQILANNEETMDISKLPNGIYFVIVKKDGSNVYQSKLIVNH